MTDPGRLSISVTDVHGVTRRWGPDEPLVTEILNDLTFTTSIPGGFKTLACSLLRRITLDYPDLGLLDHVRVYGPGNETVWEGRWQSFPRTHSPGNHSISPNAIGHAAHLTDDISFREIYVDQGKTRWGGASVQRRLNLLGSGISPGDPTVVQDATTGEAAVLNQIAGTWTGAALPQVDAVYDGQGIPLGSVYYAWKIGPTINHADTNWEWFVSISDDDVLSSHTATANLRAAGPGTGTLAAGLSDRPFAIASLHYGTGPAGAEGDVYPLFWTALTVYGDHGLTKRGSDTAVTGKGLYASDIIDDCVSRAAPLLTRNGIQATTFVIPHATYLEPCKAEDVILDVNKYHLWQWGVYDDRDFFYRPWDDTSDVWEVSLAGGASFSPDGEDAENIFNGVLVSFTDPSGRRCYAGPPGALADYTDASLEDTSPTNPVNAHGIPRRWGRLDISTVTTPAAAVALGALWLIEYARPGRRGNLSLVGFARHPTKGLRPVSRIRAGQHIRITDHPYSGARRIIETSYSHGGRQIGLTLDNSNHALEAIIERMGVQLIGVIT